MTDTPRCEPPEHLRDRDGWHWVETHATKLRLIRRWWRARGEWCWADMDERTLRSFRYLAPATPPAVVAALVKALEHAALQLEYMDGRSPSGTTPAVLVQITAALAAYKEAGR